MARDEGVRREVLADLSAVAELARLIAPALRPGDQLALNGPMGSGKTTFVRALVEALGGDPACVSSPTFTLLHRYQARLPVIHVDACRLDGWPQLAALGVDDDIAADGVLAVEWADRVAEALTPTWRLVFAHAAVGRVVEIAGPLRQNPVR
ncbi:MAG: tRNA (adenosine(37)-N6)-threonylcarbamoyltransferase complex ATPase subunit type 1 TsaE [Planctomycetota bacterium]|nr:tRNA (adenosine(37)-N6)-threonylcarbamoyltransferase complex ATPase subunit type 1 TsaE [Planctomycetota bacterium]MCX8039183.1 tRNA (adenosine(37)-N6)-threonylcarbamoyltransferase complex ATPase subunit type 1 TsaE [Planctomycetota bacterium]MDW8373545.1 tRNA (adenosine(37)-N6)-threonylcarbamoyltransferase complex ATPase subunit type 1 TsaE [Planctomycetota bacterium]